MMPLSTPPGLEGGILVGNILVYGLESVYNKAGTFKFCTKDGGQFAVMLKE